MTSLSYVKSDEAFCISGFQSPAIALEDGVSIAGDTQVRMLEENKSRLKQLTR